MRSSALNTANFFPSWVHRFAQDRPVSYKRRRIPVDFPKMEWADLITDW